jgi:hypothetical protein
MKQIYVKIIAGLFLLLGVVLISSISNTANAGYIENEGFCSAESIAEGCGDVYNEVLGEWFCMCDYDEVNTPEPTPSPEIGYFLGDPEYLGTFSHTYVQAAGGITKTVDFAETYDCNGGTFIGWAAYTEFYWQKFQDFGFNLYVDGANSFGDQGMITVTGNYEALLIQTNGFTPMGIDRSVHTTYIRELFPTGLKYKSAVGYNNKYNFSGDIKSNFNGTVWGYPVCYGDLPEPDPPSCADNYTLGDTLTTSAVNSASSAGQMLEFPISPGEFYALEFTAPPWIDNGTTEASYEADIAVMWPPTPPLATWVHLKEWPGVCIEDLEEGRYRAYFQGDILTSQGFYGIRARDMETVDNYANNNGNLSYILKEAGYNPLPSSCSSQFTDMALRNSAQIWTDRPNGYPLPLAGPLEPNQWYALEVNDFPYFDNGNSSYRLEISTDNGATWQDLETWAYCVNRNSWDSFTYYFQSVAGVWLQIRAHDGNGAYWDNEGILNYNLYYSFNYTPPEGGNCSSNFSIGSKQGSYSVPANKQLGTEITSYFTADQWYALEITDPIWLDSVGTPSLSADITRDPPNALPWQTWHNLTDWPGAACVEMVNTDYARVYFKAQSPLSYYLRAHSTDANWTNNSGDVTFDIYSVTATDPDPPPSSCEASYDAGFWVGSGEIYATLSEGQVLNLTPGRTYRLETIEGPWYDNGNPSYGVEISQDGGSNWNTLENSGLAGITGCVVPLSDGVHIRVYFTTGSGPYRLRVHDQTANYGDNSGSIGYRLYMADDLTDDPIELPPSWNMGCSAICNRPDGVLEVANWLEYGRCELFKYISWCDYHTAAFMGVQDVFLSREPFSTILEFRNMANSIKYEFESYEWSEDGGGDSLTAPANIIDDARSVLMTLPDDSPYNNGKISLTPAASPLSTVCAIEMSKAVGTKLSQPICLALDAMNRLGVTTWIQFLFDATLLAIFLLYIYQRWIKPGVGA